MYVAMIMTDESSFDQLVQYKLGAVIYAIQQQDDRRVAHLLHNFFRDSSYLKLKQSVSKSIQSVGEFSNLYGTLHSFCRDLVWVIQTLYELTNFRIHSTSLAWVFCRSGRSRSRQSVCAGCWTGTHLGSRDSGGLKRMEVGCGMSRKGVRETLFGVKSWGKGRSHDDCFCENGNVCSHVIGIRLFRFGICFCYVFSLDRIRRRCPFLANALVKICEATKTSLFISC
ncbi:hypothetical protein BpHYR1_034377 [Brachionus plicatilis]|uniref:Uncharacterized protein n=1 Tax=Brachionus plicatilis TaxID=10195 RepID=A0A3M7SVP9_BRAPC|nr:hypothetical protein BpHYR1_034377 [Brachionus plicatilis]